MSETKPHKSIEEQISILQSRDLVIEDVEYAKKKLSYISYYRLSGYSLTVRENDRFYCGVTFNNIIDLYDFDSELRSAFLHLLSNIEVNFRTQIANIHTEEYGPLGYCVGKGFLDKHYFTEFYEKLTSVTCDGKTPCEVFVKHHNQKYGGSFPLWVAVELLPFSWISKLYANMSIDLKEKIAMTYYTTGYKYIQNWLRGLSEIRNICAHCGRLYNRLLTYTPRLSSHDTKILNPESTKYKLFSFIYISAKLVSEDHEWDKFINAIEASIREHSFISLKYYGFPENWREILNNVRAKRIK